MKVAAVQLALGADKAENLDKMCRQAERAARESCQLVVFPEASMRSFGGPKEPLAACAEALDGPFVSAVSRLARKCKIWLAAGMFERIPGSDRVYNTVIVIDDAGKLIGSYRKIHLYDAFGLKESEQVEAGDGSTLLCETGGMRLAVMTCYDLRFPELCRHLSRQGAQLILLPAAWYQGHQKEAQLKVLARARAIENGVYLAAAVQTGKRFTGNTMIIDPQGVVLSSLGDEEGLVTADISPDRMESVRRKSPSDRNSRFDLYSRWYAG